MTAFPILLVDDDELELKATRAAFDKAQIPSPLYVARDGLQALAWLRGDHAAASAPRPGLVLLDLNMPHMNGIAFLSALRAEADEELQRIPVVVMTTSTEERERHEAYRLGAAGFIVKPVRFGDFVNICKVVHNYWHHCTLP